MKNRLNILLCILVSYLLVACGDDSNETSSTLRVSKSNIDFAATGGTLQIPFEGDKEITAISGADWCRIVEITHENFSIMVRPNTDYAGRATRVTISDGTSTQVISVTQQGDVFAPEADKQVMRLGNEATTVPIEINSSFGYTVAISSGTDWLTIEKINNGFSLSLAANETGAPRACIVRVKSDQDRIFDYTIYQYDIEDLLGNWSYGSLYSYWDDHIISDGLALVVSPVTITANTEDENYTISIPLEKTLIGKAMRDPSKATLRLQASYQEGAFVISSLQPQDDLIMDLENNDGTTVTLYGATVTLSGGSFYSKGDIGIAPVLYGGQIFLSYNDVSTTPGEGDAFLTVGFFSDRELTDLQDYILFPGLEIYK